MRGKSRSRRCGGDRRSRRIRRKKKTRPTPKSPQCEQPGAVTTIRQCWGARLLSSLAFEVYLFLNAGTSQLGRSFSSLLSWRHAAGGFLFSWRPCEEKTQSSKFLAASVLLTYTAGLDGGYESRKERAPPRRALMSSAGPPPAIAMEALRLRLPPPLPPPPDPPGIPQWRAPAPP